MTSQPAEVTMPVMPSKTDPRRAQLAALGSRIQKHRKAREITQAELAEKLNISVAYVSLIERGGRNPPFTTVLALAKALGVPATMLVD